MKKIKQYIIAASLLISMAGCNDYLDREPISDYPQVGFYDSEKALNVGVTGVYNRVYMHISGSNIPYMTLFDMYTGMGIERQIDNSIGAGQGMATSFIWESLWANLYSSIATCNAVLEGVQPFMNIHSKSTVSRQYIAEVKTLRAYFYYYLINTYGDVPYITGLVRKDEYLTITRKPVDEILPLIFADLDDAAKDLPWKYTSSEDWGRADRSFALGVKTRLALNAGSISAAKGNTAKANEYFRIAAQTAKEIIDNSGRSLASDYHSLFTRAGQLGSGAKSENIFQIMYGGSVKDAQRQTHYISWGEYSRNIGQSGRFPTQMLVDTYEMKNGKRIDEPGSGYDPRKPFANRDSRLDATIYKHGDVCIASLDGTTKIKFLINIYFDKTTFFNADGTTETRTNLDRNSNVAQYGLAENGVGYLWRKYNYFDDEPASAPTYNYILMRYAEILLAYAEAKIELNEIDATVYDAIDQVRLRAGQPSLLVADASRAGNQDKMRQIVRRERKIEFMDEGLHLYDLRRWRVGDLENKQPTYGFPILANVDKLSLNVDSYPLATADMVPSYGAKGSREDLNDMPDYSKFADKLRVRDKNRYWNDMFYLSPIPLAERNKAPQITQNPGYGN